MTIYASSDFDSSFIKTIGWNSLNKDLMVHFKSGSFWIYYNVPKKDYSKLIAAPSVGQYFNKNIRDVYSSAKFNIENFLPIEHFSL
jgi:hypothetical protein